jgi:UDP-2,3-diacylglucosamine hydrolase
VNAGSPPGLQVWRAPRQWRAIDFISDLHLSPELPLTVAAWAHYLHRSTADAICMLGDVFEVWVGDDSRHQPFEQGLVQALSRASALRPLYFMAGNRDFLVGADLCAEAGLTALPDPTLLQAWDRRLLLCHGDAQCLDDLRYQAFRSEVRSVTWQQAFLARPLSERMAIAREMRRQSMNRLQRPDETSGDLDADACRRLLHDAGADRLLHGHTHRPGAHDLGDGLSRVVLSDWDLDGSAAPRAEVLRLTADGRLQRLTPAAACAR